MYKKRNILNKEEIKCSKCFLNYSESIFPIKQGCYFQNISNSFQIVWKTYFKILIKHERKTGKMTSNSFLTRNAIYLFIYFFWWLKNRSPIDLMQLWFLSEKYATFRLVVVWLWFTLVFILFENVSQIPLWPGGQKRWEYLKQ